MRAHVWNGLAWATAAVVVASGASGCKAMNERYIALEVWKYEKCFGQLPPGFVPRGAQPPMAAPPPGRVCGQGGPAPCAPPPMAGCNDCGGMGGHGMPMAPGGAPGMPTPAGVTAGRPVIISDELVVP